MFYLAISHLNLYFPEFHIQWEKKPRQSFKHRKGFISTWVDAYFDFLKKQHVPIKKIYTFSFRFDKGVVRLCFRKSEETWFPAFYNNTLLLIDNTVL